ncbi:IST1 homolog isoform X2 [Stegodyphus dumicola]|uniref:IST1 homolog isoform X2 n=1 Tax=Stegodyphus dumicola TaxID=202533 RepID=UPI0015AAF43C|nr:IST1 homolog isoform X2 [Stegodyphus dumicola]
MYLMGKFPELKRNLILTIGKLEYLAETIYGQAQNEKRRIADYLAKGKFERARICVEDVIYQEQLIEGIEELELQCEILRVRIRFIQQEKPLDQCLAEAVLSLIWAADHLKTDIEQLKMIARELEEIYGEPYVLAARENVENLVNKKLIHKFSVQVPPKSLVEKYLIEIAKSHKVPYEVFAAEEEAQTEPSIDLSDECKSLMHHAGQYPQHDLTMPFNYPAPNVNRKGASVPPDPSVQPNCLFPGRLGNFCTVLNRLAQIHECVERVQVFHLFLHLFELPPHRNMRKF